MKKRAIALIFPACLLILLLLSLIFLPSCNSAEDFIHLLERRGSTMLHIAEKALAEQTPSFTEDILLKRYGIESIRVNDGIVLFSLKTAAIEGHRCLVYAPDGYTPACLSWYDNWTPAETGTAFLRWEGGMMGWGYINLHTLANGFYLEEAYLPT